ncbi:MAG: hypothetical protein ABR999_08990 [Methanoregula sp.]|jgi:hypothetical protein|uniref:hypothetical protein n=1 Tax=Methanoregula sp. TaxID=2052170 RepID=UPI003D0E35AF
MSRQRRLNHNVRPLLTAYLVSCTPGTKVNAKDLARQLSDRDRVILAGTVAHILQGRRGLCCTSVNDYVVV